MSGNGSSGFDRDDNGDLRDPALRRALAHAPDSDATPDPRTRDAILKMAHNLAATVPPASNAAANSASAAPWWRRVFGGGGEPRSRMPWNAAFATVLLATFVTVLWHREPVPDAQLDGEARVAGAAAPVASPPPPAPAPAPAQPSAEAAPPAAAARKAPAAEQKQAQAQRDALSKEAPAIAGADVVRRPAPPPQAAPAPIAPAPALPPAIVAEQAAPARSDEQREERVESERRRAYAVEAPALAAVPAPSIAPPPPPIAAPAPAAAPPHYQGDNANADASGALRAPASRAAAPKAVARGEGPSAFTALDRWTSFSFTGSGAEVRHARGDIEGLPALVGTVARSATMPDDALAAPVEARLSLYRGSALVAVLEIAGGQVRWAPQPNGTALVGTPPAQALDALRALLTR